MIKLPQNIITIFYKFLSHDIPIHDFEEWIYNSTELERELGETLYYEFISLDYKKELASVDLEMLILEHIDICRYPSWSLKRILLKLLERNEECAFYIRQIDSFYHAGCGFLDKLYDYSLKLIRVNKFGNLEFKENSKKIAEGFFPKIEIEIRKVIEWLDSETILVFGEDTSLIDLKIIDNRFNKNKKLF